MSQPIDNLPDSDIIDFIRVTPRSDAALGITSANNTTLRAT
jgi:hypothetical protein